MLNFKRMFNRNKKNATFATKTKTIFDILRPYQKDAVDTTLTNDRGIVCLPTGTGKTFCQSAIIADDILKRNNGFGMYVVNAPRILLTYQLLKEVYSFLLRHKIEARYMFVHSGSTIDRREIRKIKENFKIEGKDIPFSEIISGTNPTEIAAFMQIAQRQNLPLVMFSTYNSANQIETARLVSEFDNIRITLNDEAHYLIQEQFHNIIDTISDDREYFFTATRRSPESYDPNVPYLGRGMDNVEKYGELLYNMTPREAIELGRMVRPRLHFVNTNRDYNSDDFDISMNRIIKTSYEQHGEVLGGKISPKLLVTTKESPDILNFLNSIEYQELRDDNVEVFAIASNPLIGCDINGEKVSRTKFLKELKRKGELDNVKMIILHYDILAEGIDVSGFTGMLPLRTLNMSKFLQTYGRCGRVHPKDSERINSGEITSDDIDKMIKPYAYIILPNITLDNEDDKNHLTRIVHNMREIGFDTNEDVILTTEAGGFSEEEEVEMMNEIDRIRREVGIMIINYDAEIENEQDAQLTSVGWMDKVSNKLNGF